MRDNLVGAADSLVLLNVYVELVVRPVEMEVETVEFVKDTCLDEVLLLNN